MQVRKTDRKSLLVEANSKGLLEETKGEYLLEEIKLVMKAVDGFMQKLCNSIGVDNAEMKCRPYLVGSASEDTRPFIPDEYRLFC